MLIQRPSPNISSSYKTRNRLFLILLVFTLQYTSLGQRTRPDAGNLLQEAERQRDVPEFNQSNVVIEDQGQPETEGEGEFRITIDSFVFKGATFFSSEQLQRKSDPYLNRPVSFTELSAMLGHISQAYRDEGRLARVFLPEQDIENGSIEVMIIEAMFGDVKIENKCQLLDDRTERRTLGFMNTGQSRDKLLNLHKLERSAMLLNESPGVSSNVVLSAGQQSGFTDIVAIAAPTSPLAATALIDNYGSRSTGTLRFTGVAQASNALGHGELVQLNLLYSEGNNYGAASIQYPISHNGLKAGISASLLNYDLVKEFASLKASGEALSTDINLTYPLIRSSKSRMDIKARFGQRNFTNRQASRIVADKDINAMNIELRGHHTDAFGGGGEFFYGLNSTFGDLDLSGNLINQRLDRFGPQTDGTYSLLGVHFGRRQRLSDLSALKLSFEGQQASKNLDSSETFVLGGPNRVRAYPVLEGVGDDGYFSTAEFTRKLNEKLTASLFYDYGQVTKKPTNISPKSTNALQGLGASINYRGNNRIFAKLTLAHRIGENPFRSAATGNDSDGSYQPWRLWAQIGKSF